VNNEIKLAICTKSNRVVSLILLLVKHNYTAFRRSQFFRQNFTKYFFRTLPIIYILLFGLFASIYFEKLLREALKTEIISKFNLMIVPLFSSITAVRMIFSPTSLKNLRCYLVLPMKKSKLANAFLLKGFLSWLTILPVLFLLPFWYSAMIKGAYNIDGIFWLLKVLILNWLAYLYSFLGRILLIDKFTIFLLVALIFVVFFIASNLMSDRFVLLMISDILFNSSLNSTIIQVLLLTVLMVLSSMFVSKTIANKMTLDTLSK